jgi:tRNA pseudouridine38-40 synthase
MRNIKLLLSYDGSCCHGWQRQRPPSVTLQGVLEEALKVLLREEVHVIASGRTDAGVHALGQVANFHTHNTKIPLSGIKNGLNALLPNYMAVLQAEEVPLDFHARKHALCKVYVYCLISAQTPLPLWRRHAWVLKTPNAQPLNLKAMQQGAAFFLGTHDFKTFQASGSSVTTTIRTVHNLFIEEGVSGLIPCNFPLPNMYFYTFTVAANGFLRYMVRNMVGLLVSIGMGKTPPGYVKTALLARDRSVSAPTAPAQGLFLKQVIYTQEELEGLTSAITPVSAVRNMDSH